MNNKTVNLTLLNATKQLNEFITKHPGKFYRKALTNQEFRQNLIDYIVLRIPNRYRSAEESHKQTVSTETIKIVDKEKMQIEKLIYQGFYYLLRNEDKAISVHKSITTEEALTFSSLVK